MKKTLAIMATALICGTSAAYAVDDQKLINPPTDAVDEKVKMMDTNRNGVVSRSEYIAAGGENVVAVDANHDGIISKSELMSKMGIVFIDKDVVAKKHEHMKR